MSQFVSARYAFPTQVCIGDVTNRFASVSFSDDQRQCVRSPRSGRMLGRVECDRSMAQAYRSPVIFQATIERRTFSGRGAIPVL